MTKIHDLRDRVTLLKRSVVEGEDGSFQEKWKEKDEVWAHVTPLIGREVLGEEWNTLKSTTSKYKIILRYRRYRFSRVIWEERILGLLCPPMADQRRQWITCLMYEVGEVDE